jgi:hypothetical protein
MGPGYKSKKIDSRPKGGLITDHFKVACMKLGTPETIQEDEEEENNEEDVVIIQERKG